MDLGNRYHLDRLNAREMRKAVSVINKNECDAENLKPVAALSPAILHYLCKDYDINANMGTRQMAFNLIDWVSFCSHKWVPMQY